MNEITTYRVYTMTLRGSFSLKYEGAEEMEALTAYNKLIDANKPRCWTVSTGNMSVVRIQDERFPQ